MRKIIVAGHICLDITPVFPMKKEFNQVQELLSPGQLIQMGQAKIHTGGSVANTGLALKMLGADVTLLGKLGNDEFGKIVIDIAKQNGASGFIVDDTTSTSYSVVIAIPGIDRIFLHHTGANDTFKLEDIPEESFEGAELFHFGYPPLMRSMYENDGDELIRILKHVHEKKIPISLDMASVDPNSDAGKANWKKIVTDVAQYVDYFVPSYDEMKYMLGDKSPKEIADELVSYGARNVLIKCGEDGLYYRSADKEGHIDAIKPPIVASATGAGDTCIAAYLMAMLNGESVETAAKLAAAEGSCCVTSYDALSGLKTLDELKKMI